MTLDVRLITPPGPAGVAVLELLGPRAEAAAGALARGALPGEGEAWVRTLRNPADGIALDEALVVRRPGDRVLELHLHGGPAVVEGVLRALSPKARTQSVEERARGLAPLVPHALGAELVLTRGQGLLRRDLEELLRSPSRRREAALRLVANWDRIRRFTVRPRVVLAGPTNAGKSTLFNVLLGREAALTSAVHGTTRDALGHHAQLGGWSVVLVDTAGQRAIPVAEGERGLVEAQGQAQAREAAAGADLVLHLARAGEREGDPPADLRTGAALTMGQGPPDWPPWHISALEHPAHARGVVDALVQRAFGDPGELFRAVAGEGEGGIPFGDDLVAALRRLGEDPSDPLGLDAVAHAL